MILSRRRFGGNLGLAALGVLAGGTASAAVASSKDAGIRTELMVVPGAFHGFDMFAPSTKLALDFTETKMTALKRAFAGQF